MSENQQIITKLFQPALEEIKKRKHDQQIITKLFQPALEEIKKRKQESISILFMSVMVKNIKQQ